MTTHRSHPPSLTTLARQTLTQEIDAKAGDRILVATSGGPDSLVLLSVLASLRTKLHFEIVAHGVDHGLRKEAECELDLAETFASSLQVPFDRTRVHVELGGNLQARARALRYEALRNAAKNAHCTRIATAHHADDRAETVLSRLLRGSGPRGLAVLPAQTEDRIRPLIRARKAEILEYAKRHQIVYATDPSNASPRFLRTRIRVELLPLLESMNPSIVAHLCALADQLDSAQNTDAALDFSLSRETQKALILLAETGRGEVLLSRGLVVRAARAVSVRQKS